MFACFYSFPVLLFFKNIFMKFFFSFSLFVCLFVKWKKKLSLKIHKKKISACICMHMANIFFQIMHTPAYMHAFALNIALPLYVHFSPFCSHLFSQYFPSFLYFSHSFFPLSSSSTSSFSINLFIYLSLFLNDAFCLFGNKLSEFHYRY